MARGYKSGNLALRKRPDLSLALRDYRLCEQFGVLPFSGGLREQPHSVILYFSIIRDAEAEDAKKRMEQTRP